MTSEERIAYKKEYNRIYRQRNKDKISELKRKHRESNKEKIKEYEREYLLKKKLERDMSIYENHGKAWTIRDLKYLKKWYPVIGPTALSYELGRTPKTLGNKYRQIRNDNNI